MKPDLSDRAIAEHVGVSPTTVGAVRESQLSKLDSSQSEPATSVTTSIHEARAALKVLQRHLHRLVVVDPVDDDLKGIALYHAGMIEEALEDICTVESEG